MLPLPRHCPACNHQWMGNLGSQCENCFPNAFLLEDTTEQHAVDWHMNQDAHDIYPTQVITVAVGLVVKDGKILLSQRHDYHSDYWGRWQSPGGGVEPKEHPRDAVVRELKEENGINVKVVKWICNTMVNKPDSKGLLVIHYLCTTQDEPVETDESLRPEWCDPEVLIDKSRPLMTAMNAVRGELCDAVAEYLFDLQSDNAGGDRKP